MAISVQAAQKGMLVRVVPNDETATTAQFFKDSAKKNKLYAFEKGKYIGKIIDISVANNSVKVQFPVRLKLGLLVYSSGWVNPIDLAVNPLKASLPPNIADYKTLYVLPGKKDVLVRRSPITGTALAAVNGNQMVKATGKTQSGYTEVVLDTGTGWIATKFLTETKPTTVIVAPQPSVQQEPPTGGTTGDDDKPVPGVIYLPTEKPDDTPKTVLTVLLSIVGVGLLYKIFKPKSKSI